MVQTPKNEVTMAAKETPSTSNRIRRDLTTSTAGCVEGT